MGSELLVILACLHFITVNSDMVDSNDLRT